MRSRAFIRDKSLPIPIIQGRETTGANSIAVMDNNKRKGGRTLIVVGGDFQHDSSSRQNCFLSNNRGLSWTASKKPPRGYRSCVEYISEKHVITCGTTGVDYSNDGGKTWKPVSDEGFHVVRVAKAGNAVFIAGSNGKIGKLVYPK